MRELDRAINLFLHHKIHSVIGRSTRFNSSSVNKCNPPASIDPLHMHCVSSSASEVVSDDSRLLQEVINQRWLAHVGFTNNRKLNWLSFHFVIAAQLLLWSTRHVASKTVQSVQRVYLIIRIEIWVVFWCLVHKIEFLFPTFHECADLRVIVLFLDIRFFFHFFFFDSYNFIQQHLFKFVKPFYSFFFSILILDLFAVRNMPLDHLKKVRQSISVLCWNENWVVGLLSDWIYSCCKLGEFSKKICHNLALKAILRFIRDVQYWWDFI